MTKLEKLSTVINDAAALESFAVNELIPDLTGCESEVGGSSVEHAVHSAINAFYSPDRRASGISELERLCRVADSPAPVAAVSMPDSPADADDPERAAAAKLDLRTRPAGELSSR